MRTVTLMIGYWMCCRFILDLVVKIEPELAIFLNLILFENRSTINFINPAIPGITYCPHGKPASLILGTKNEPNNWKVLDKVGWWVQHLFQVLANKHVFVFSKLMNNWVQILEIINKHNLSLWCVQQRENCYKIQKIIRFISQVGGLFRLKPH